MNTVEWEWNGHVAKADRDWLTSPRSTESLRQLYTWSAWTSTATTAVSSSYFPDPWLATGGVLSQTGQFMSSSKVVMPENWTVVEFPDPQWARWNTVLVETAEQKLIREQAYAAEQVRIARCREEQVRLAQEQAALRQAANSTARQLLLGLLNAQQKRDVLEHGWFEVISSRGRRWRIRIGNLTGNVDLMPAEGEPLADQRLASYCAHAPRDGMPLDDHHLAQKLMLEADEDLFTQVAYIHYRRADIPLDQLPKGRVQQPQLIAAVA